MIPYLNIALLSLLGQLPLHFAGGLFLTVPVVNDRFLWSMSDCAKETFYCESTVPRMK